MTKVKVDEDACIGCGTCVAVCEIAFEMKNGKAKVKSNAESAECIKKAIDACPVDCIKME